MRTAGLGLLIELAPDDVRGLRDIRAGVRTELGPGWSVGYLFPPPRTADLGRFFLARGDVPASPVYPLPALAYDMSRGLADRLLAQVEPDLPSSSYRLDGAAPVQQQTVMTAAGLSSADKWWSVKNVRADEAWNVVPDPGGAARGVGILVGHIDTGYTQHPEIYQDALNLTIDRDILDGDDDALDPLIKRWWFPLDNPGHGTGTSCVIASRTAGEVVGTAPEASVVPIRSIVSVVQVLDGDVARAVDYARSVGCRVISMSLGGRGFNGLQAAIARAVDEGIIVMAAAGNYVGFVSAPASYPECLAVAASTIDDQPWSGSSRGSEVDISAPGQAVWTAATNKGPNGPVYSIEQGDGTSFAVAALAGIAALWLAHHDPAVIAAKAGRSGQPAQAEGQCDQVRRMAVFMLPEPVFVRSGPTDGRGTVDREGEHHASPHSSSHAPDGIDCSGHHDPASRRRRTTASSRQTGRRRLRRRILLRPVPRALSVVAAERVFVRLLSDR